MDCTVVDWSLVRLVLGDAVGGALVVRLVSLRVVVGAGTIVENPPPPLGDVGEGCTVVVIVVGPNPGHRTSTKPPDNTIPNSDFGLTLRSPQASLISSSVSCSPLTQLAEHCLPFVKSFLVQPSISDW